MAGPLGWTFVGVRSVQCRCGSWTTRAYLGCLLDPGWIRTSPWVPCPLRSLPRNPARAAATTSGQAQTASLGFSSQVRLAQTQLPGLINC